MPPVDFCSAVKFLKICINVVIRGHKYGGKSWRWFQLSNSQNSKVARTHLKRTKPTVNLSPTSSNSAVVTPYPQIRLGQLKISLWHWCGVVSLLSQGSKSCLSTAPLYLAHTVHAGVVTGLSIRTWFTRAAVACSRVLCCTQISCSPRVKEAVIKAHVLAQF